MHSSFLIHPKNILMKLRHCRYLVRIFTPDLAWLSLMMTSMVASWWLLGKSPPLKSTTLSHCALTLSTVAA